jgi:ABC-type branched-subunit amino acid transport system ATPase component/ABC-type branched-subunit amino acid transport system permease subunit
MASSDMPGGILLPLIGGCVAGASLAAAIAAICRNLHGHYQAVATLALGTIFSLVVLKLNAITGGFTGLTVPAPSLFGRTLSPVEYFWFCLVASSGVLLVGRRITHASLGRRFAALRDDEKVLQSVGFGTLHVRVLAFGLSGAICGLAGGLFAFNTQFIAADNFNLNLAVTLLLMAILGGIRTLPGAFVGAAIVVGLQQVLAGLGQYNDLVSSLALLFLILFVPRGLLEFVRTRWPTSKSWSRGLAAASEPVASRGPTPATRPLITRTGRLLTLEAVSVTFGGLRAVHDLSMEVGPGRITGLIGPNGAGKTTVLDVASGFRMPTAGRVMLDARDITGMSAPDRAKLGVVRSFQQARVLSDTSVEDNILLAAERGGRASGHARSMLIMDTLGILPFRKTPAGELSFATRRLIELGRVLALEPNTALLDEPFAGLDVLERERIAALISDLRSSGCSVLLIEHDIEWVMSLCDEVVVLGAGSVIATGGPSEIRRNAAVKRAYLGGTG